MAVNVLPNAVVSPESLTYAGGMTLHLIKLCVGVESVEDLAGWIDFRLGEMRRAGETPEHQHRTRMIPKRVDDVLDGGSLYWVIRGVVQARQRLAAIRPFRDTDGIQRCHFVMDPELIATEPQPRRPFQGWRYLREADAPRDLAESGADLRAMPPELRTTLAELGLL